MRKLAKPANTEVALNFVVRTALQKTGAAGVALALIEKGLLICRARAGNTAPDLGVALDVNAGITGACVRAGHALNCSDALADTRVDRGLCRTLGIRSVVVIPILFDGAVIGILEALSGNPNAFHSLHVKWLERLADFVREFFCGADQKTKSDVVQKLDSQQEPIFSRGRGEDAREEAVTNAELPRADNRGQEQDDPGLATFREVFDKRTSASSWEDICRELVSRLAS